MKIENKTFLDANRKHLDSINRTGTARNIQPLKFLAIMREEFQPTYGNINEWDFDQVGKLINEVYARYDKPSEIIDTLWNRED